jgi:tripartite-type tricarboxylate transporter receptor subunit TctC
MKRHYVLAAAVAVAAAAFLPTAAMAQFYKGKTVTMIVNYPAGGPADIEARIVARHLGKHVHGNPRLIVKNIGGGGGMIGSNYLGEVAKPDGLTFGFFTWNMVSEVLGDPGLRVKYSQFALIAGVKNPLVFYMRKDTPPGVKVAADIMKTNGFKALSLDAQSTNTIHQVLALDLIGIKYTPVTGYRGLKDVETAVLQNEGQLANTSLPGWTASIAPTMWKQGIVIPLWQLTAAGRDGTIKRDPAVADIPTFEEFYAQIRGGKPSGVAYETLRTEVDTLTSMFRGIFLPPKTDKARVTEMRAGFVSLWKDKAFLADYAKAVKTEPGLVTGDDGEVIIAKLANIKPEIKAMMAATIKKVTK